MRLFLMILLAGVLSAALGVAATVAVLHGLPSYDDAAGRGLAEVFQIAFAIVYAIVGMIAFGIAARRGDRALKLTLLVLLALPLAVAVIGSVSDLMRLFGWYEIRKAFFSIVQIVVPLWCVALTQWLVLRAYLRSRLTPA